MMTLNEVMEALRSQGSDATKKILIKHGAKEPFFGVSVAKLKAIQKKIKKNHNLAMELYDTGNGDAQYLAGLISEPMKMTKAQLDKWAKTASWGMIGEYTVAWTASESQYAEELALKWINSSKEFIAATGWATYSSRLSIADDATLNLVMIESLLDRIRLKIGEAPDRVKYTMNGFVIAVGCYITPLVKQAKFTAKAIGKVNVDTGDTNCKVPLALEYINKVETAGRLGRKRKTAFC